MVLVASLIIAWTVSLVEDHQVSIMPETFAQALLTQLQAYTVYSSQVLKRKKISTSLSMPTD